MSHDAVFYGMNTAICEHLYCNICLGQKCLKMQDDNGIYIRMELTFTSFNYVKYTMQ